MNINKKINPFLLCMLAMVLTIAFVSAMDLNDEYTKGVKVTFNLNYTTHSIKNAKTTNELEKKFLREIAVTKKIEKINIEFNYQQDTNYLILTRKNNVFRIKNDDHTLEDKATPHVLQFSSTNNIIKEHLKGKESAKGTYFENSCLYVNKKNQLVIPYIISKMEVKQINQDIGEPLTYYNQPITTAKICDSSVYKLESIAINESYSIAAVASSWPNIYGVIIAKEDLEKKNPAPALFERIIIKNNAYLLAVGKEDDYPYIIYGEIDNADAQSFDYRLKKIKTKYCKITIKKLVIKVNNPSKESLKNYFNNEDTFKSAKILAHFGGVPVDGSRCPFWIDYKRDLNWAIIAHTDYGYMWAKHESALGIDDFQTGHSNSDQYKNYIFSFMESDKKNALKINPEYIYEIDYDGDEKIKIFCKQGIGLLKTKLQNENLAQLKNYTENNITTPGIQTFAAGTCTNQDEVAVLTYQKYTNPFFHFINGNHKPKLLVYKKTKKE